jgi:hypothetical protein
MFMMFWGKSTHATTSGRKCLKQNAAARIGFIKTLLCAQSRGSGRLTLVYHDKHIQKCRTLACLNEALIKRMARMRCKASYIVNIQRRTAKKWSNRTIRHEPNQGAWDVTRHFLFKNAILEGKDTLIARGSDALVHVNWAL